MSPKLSLFLSVVVPVHNDADVLESFLEELLGAAASRYEHFEIVLVDDGSQDASSQVIERILRRSEGIRCLRLAGRHGWEIAVAAGFDSVVGDVVVVMSPGNDPIDRLHEMVDRVLENGSLVIGQRPENDYPRLQRIGRKVFHWLCRNFSGFEMAERTTSFVGLTRSTLNSINQIRDKFRYVKSFSGLFGYRVDFLEYKPLDPSRRSRGVLETMNLASDILISNSVRPLRLVTLLCLLLTGFYLLYMIYVMLIFLFKEQVAEGWVTLSLQNAVAFFILSLVLAVLGEYLGRVLMETRQQPAYRVKEEKNSSVLVPEEAINVVSSSQKERAEGATEP